MHLLQNCICFWKDKLAQLEKKVLCLGENQGQALSSLNSVPAGKSVLVEGTLFGLCLTVQLTKTPLKLDFEIKTVPEHVEN